jgi:ABC-type uncharacterized transport system ATPase subunit
VLQLDRITRRFGDFTAVDEVTLSVGRGEVLGLVGENGAGKSTLMRVVAGELAPDGGRMELDGEPVRFRSPSDADAHGIEMVHQHFMLVDDFTVAENLALSARHGMPAWSRRRLAHFAGAAIAASGIALRDPERRVDELSVGERSKLELIKALARRPRVLILDEPTSVLTPDESDELFRVMRRVADEGAGVVLISHKIPEIMRATDRVVVMRGGRVVSAARTSDTSAAELTDAMVGQSIPDLAESSPSAPGRGAVVLRLRNVSTSATGRAVPLQQISIEIGRGQIVALIGVAGNGQTEMADLLRGLIAPRSGAVEFDGRVMTPSALLGQTSIANIPADRTRDGIVAQMTIAENLGLALRRWQPRAASARTAREIHAFSIRARSPLQRAGSLSGGNQQKVILARELGREPKLIIASDPTRGLDIAATRFVQQRRRAAAGAGAAILLISSDLDEAFAMADAFHVMYRGSISRRLTPSEAAGEAGALMAGTA